MDKHDRLQFITVEGGEGAGKSTLIDQLARILHQQGFEVLKTREPGGTAFGEQIRKWLLSHHGEIKIGARAELLLFLAARAQHIEEVIIPSINAGKVVLCDRFNDSTIAYQGAARSLGISWVSSLCDKVCGSVKPDLTFYLDVDPKIGLKRTKKATKENAARGDFDRIEAEQLEFHQKVREAFLTFAKEEPERFHSIDAHLPKEAVLKQALHILSPYLQQSGI